MNSHIPSTIFIIAICAGIVLAAPAGNAGESPASRPLPRGSVTLPQAVALALEKHPALSLFDVDMRIAEARIIGASLLPNPELEGEAENFGGSGEFGGFGAGQYTIGISQLIELGGKRKARVSASERARDVENARYKIMRREVISETGRRFVALVVKQRQRENAAQALEIAEKAHEAVRSQVEGGRGLPSDLKQAQLAVTEARMQLDSIERLQKLAVKHLAALWQSNDPRFSVARGDVTAPGGLPNFGNLETALLQHPRLQQASLAIAEADARYRLERANAVPDITVGVGYRRDSALEDNAMVAAFSIPLSIFNRNQGGKGEARATLDREEIQRFQVETALRIDLSQAFERLAAARAEVLTVNGELLPVAEENFRTVEEGYRLGRISYLQFLEARRSLTDLRRRRIESLGRYHDARVEIEALTGQSL